MEGQISPRSLILTVLQNGKYLCGLASKLSRPQMTLIEGLLNRRAGLIIMTSAAITPGAAAGGFNAAPAI